MMFGALAKGASKAVGPMAGMGWRGAKKAGKWGGIGALGVGFSNALLPGGYEPDDIINSLGAKAHFMNQNNNSSLFGPTLAGFDRMSPDGHTLGNGIEGLGGLIGSLAEAKAGTISGATQGPPAPSGSSDLWSEMDPGAMPGSFTKTLSDYLNDSTLKGIVDQQIIAENMGIGRANKAIRDQAGRSATNNNLAGQDVQHQISQIANENLAAEKAIASTAAETGSQIVDEANQLAGTVGTSIVANDTARADMQSQAAMHGQDIAAQQKADQDLLSELASIGQDSISEIAAGEAQQTRANRSGIIADRDAAIAEGTRKAGDNWGAPRQELLGSLAQQSMEGDLARHQMALQEWTAKADRQKAWYNYQLEKQKMNYDMAAGQQGDPEMYWKMYQGMMEPASGFDVPGDEGIVNKVQVPRWATIPGGETMVAQLAEMLGLSGGTYDPEQYNPANYLPQ